MKVHGKHIIAGFAGIGKTVLGNKNPEDVIDMEIRPYKYANYKKEYTLKEWYEIEPILNENFIHTYFKAVKDEIENGSHKIIFVWLKTEVLELLEKDNIKYTIATWNTKQEGLEEFLTDLYTKRGNPSYWIEKVLKALKTYDDYINKHNSDAIILDKYETIETKLKELKWIN